MAIPFCLPSDEETEDHYRRLEQLLADIYEVLRIILTRQHPHLAVQANFDEMSSGSGLAASQPVLSDEDAAVNVRDVQLRLSQLPDLVLSTLPPRQTSASTSRRPPRVPPRKKKCKVDVVDGVSKEVSEKAMLCSAETTRTLRDQSWVQVGKELRTIADDFRCTYKKTNKGKEPLDMPELKPSTLLSLLLPSPLRNRSVWTTVLFIVGWKMLLRQR